MLYKSVLAAFFACFATCVAAQGIAARPTPIVEARLGANRIILPPQSLLQLPNPNGLIVAGDSRQSNAFGAGGTGVLFSGANFQPTLNFNGGYGGFLNLAVGNKFLYSAAPSYASPGSTSLSALYISSIGDNYNGSTVITSHSTIIGGSNGTISTASPNYFPGVNTAGTPTVPATYIITFTSASAYTVTSPVNGIIGNGVIGGSGTSSTFPTSGRNAEANFKLTNGSTVFAAGDIFTITTFGPSNPALSITNSAADANWAGGSFGSNSASNDPSNALFLLTGANDFALGGTAFTAPFNTGNPATTCQSGAMHAPCLTMQIISSIIKNAIAGGKIVFLANETPAGIGMAQNQAEAVTFSSPYYTATASPTTCCGASSGTYLFDASQYPGAAGAGGVITTTGALYTYCGASFAACNSGAGPSVGQYAATSGGVYYFNASDPVVTTGTVYLNYAIAIATTNRAVVDTLHQWLGSVSKNFVWNGVDYKVPGALAISNKVIPVDTWNALIWTNSSTYPYSGSGDLCTISYCYNIPGTLSDGGRPAMNGGLRVGTAFAAAFNKYFGYMPNIAYSPTVNNMIVAVGNGSTVSYSNTLPVSMHTGNTAIGSIPPITLVAGGVICSEGGTGTFACGSVSGTINRTSGAYSITFTAAPSNGTHISFFADNTTVGGGASGVGFNIIENPLLDPNLTVGASSTCTPIPTALPAPWGCSGVLNGLSLATSTTVDANGYPALKLVFSGVATVASKITLTNTVNLASSKINSSTPDIVRSGITTVMSAGANGHLYGINGVAPISTVVSSVAFNRNGQYLYTAGGAMASLTTVNAAGPASSNNVSFTDLDLALPGNSSGISLELVSPPVSTQGMTISSATLSVYIQYAAGPVSGTVIISRPWMRIRSN